MNLETLLRKQKLCIAAGLYHQQHIYGKQIQIMKEVQREHSRIQSHTEHANPK